MFSEVRPSLIFLARVWGGLIVDMLLLAPGRPRCPPWSLVYFDLTTPPKAAVHGYVAELTA